MSTATLPIFGLIELVVNPSLWRHIIWPVVLTAIFALLELFFLFWALYAPVERFAVSYASSYLSPVMATIAILILSLTLAVLFLTIVFASARSRLFQAVLRRRGLKLQGESTLVANVSTELRKALLRAIVWILSLPLHLIPIVGSVVYFALNGYFLAWDLLSYYFEAKGMKFRDQKDFLRRNRLSLIAFGSVAMVLLFIPFLGILCLFGNVAAAALWAMDIESGSEIYGAR